MSDGRVTHPLLVASRNADIGFAAGMELLRAGAPALDAAVAVVQRVEDNPKDHTVGYGGLPNLHGDVELDAMVMDGSTLKAGAVAALKGFRHPVVIARKVLETLPHVLLAGEGAAEFAREMGFEEESLLTDEARTIWKRRLEAEADGLPPGVARYYRHMARLARSLAKDPEAAAQEHGTDVTGTVIVIAQDHAGHLAVATSTSGWAWKYPGRVGDTPIPGAGGYADNRYGAAGCTGRGEMAMRAVTARSVVLYMKMGLPLWSAAREAVLDLYALEDEFASGVTLYAVDAHGNHVGMSNQEGRTYIFQTAHMTAPAERPCIFVGPDGRWHIPSS
ncbi:MAG: N(4)-(beta-N-acetylglucosaminyl)-L-asparaginase [Ardenticatenia bacterium]|nr:N(4)-(beta-N-acetylglucosaminyl)-L-asparaginase [Ardenticatenia bacterium]